MQSSEVLTDLLPALCAARSAFPAIVRNCSAVARGGREYQYADLSAIADATSGILAQHGLVLVQAVCDGENGQLCIRSTLYHTSGQWLSCALSVPKPTSMQEVGSLSTYIRRYQQSALLNIVTEDDDDAASTQGAMTTAASHTPAVPAASTNGHAQAAARPTVEQVDALVALAESAHEPKEVFATQLRRIMGLTGEVRISKKFLRESMTLTQFEVARAYYERVLKQQVEEDVPDGSPRPSGHASTSTPGEGMPLDAEVDAREALVREGVEVQTSPKFPGSVPFSVKMGCGIICVTSSNGSHR